MSGDVQPRKRKDKKRKKDELGAEEPRGTAATLGEGDVFLHSHHDHGTGGHWCAKVIFFSLLAVLVTLIGLIILENRGLSELEANAVESRYSGMLEGWLEDAPDDDHHDAHTLELNHHDDVDEDDHYIVHRYNDHNEHEVDEPEEENETHEDDDDDEVNNEVNENLDDDVNSEEDEDDANNEINEDVDANSEENEDDDVYSEENEDGDVNSKKNENDDVNSEENEDDVYEDDNNEQDQDLDNNDEEDEENYDSQELGDNDDNEDETNEEEPADDEDDDEHDTEEADEDDEVEVEKIEQEASEEEPISTELPALPEEDDDEDTKDDDDDEVDDLSSDTPDGVEDEDDNRDNDDDDDDFLEADDEPVERITAPAGKPFKEVEDDEDDVSTEKPPDTLEEEEEYEKQQEEKRREEEKSSHMWLKLAVGGALLVATHAVVRRASAPRDEAEEERVTREATPIDRRMTLIPEEPVEIVLTKKVSQGIERPVTEEFVKREAQVVKASPILKQYSDEEELEEPEEIDEEIEEIEESIKEAEKKEDKELYSEEEVEEEEEEEIVIPKKETPKLKTPTPEPEPAPEAAIEAEPEIEDDDVADDVEIIEDEQLEEELEEEEDDISDVDDTDLLSRLEAKYGRLPEPERPGQKHKDGGNSVEDDWPGEPVEAYWRQQLDNLEQELRQGDWSAVIQGASVPQLQSCGRARYLLAAALDRQAEAKRDNRLLSRAIAAYLEVLKQSDNLSDKKLIDIATRTLNRIQFRGNYLNAEPVYRLLIRRFPDEPAYRNNLTVSFLMANRADLAGEVLKETLTLWPDDRVALAHHGFVLKTQYNKLEEAVDAFEKALKGDKGPACEPRFYYHYGDALLLLGRYKEAHEVHKRGAKYGHFLSPAQRSLYNVNRLKGQPWWDVNDTPYSKLAKALETSWKEILKEGEAAKALYEKEKEGLKERGDWSQMDLFVRGQEIPGRCKRAPVTCSIVRGEPAAGTCTRGQIKFSAMEPGTHVRPHVGPTNCRLRMHLGLTNTKHTYIRVDQETRQWQEGKVLIFDDSFEHEVWHNGTGKRLVLIVDVWHPELTQAERRSLPAI